MTLSGPKCQAHPHVPNDFFLKKKKSLLGRCCTLGIYTWYINKTQRKQESSPTLTSKWLWTTSSHLGSPRRTGPRMLSTKPSAWNRQQLLEYDAAVPSALQLLGGDNWTSNLYTGHMWLKSPLKKIQTQKASYSLTERGWQKMKSQIRGNYTLTWQACFLTTKRYYSQSAHSGLDPQLSSLLPALWLSWF